MNNPSEEHRRLRFGVFLHDEEQRQVLTPVAERLRSKHDVLLSDDISAVVSFNPHVVIAGERAQPFNFHVALPFAIVVRVRHDLSSKQDLSRLVGPSDYACISSYSVRSWLLETGFEPYRDFWVTGCPCTDPLCGPETPALPFTVPAGKKVVLYAPTGKTWLTSVHLLGSRTLELLHAGRDDVFIVVRPDPENATRQAGWLRNLRAAAAGRSDVFISEGSEDELNALLKAADVLVTDISEVMLLFLARDQPIVLLTNPGYRGAKHFDEKSFVWLWRDLGEEVHDADEVPAAISRALDQPAALAHTRLVYRKKLFGDLTDGGSSQRLALRLDRLRHEAAGPMRMMVQSLWSKLAGPFVRSHKKSRQRRSEAEAKASSA